MRRRSANRERFDRRGLAGKLKRQPVRVFAYRLALAMGRVDVDAMLDELTWPQLREWMAYYEIDPWGGSRADLGAAIVASTMANIWGRKSKTYRVSDFLPTFGARRQTKAEIGSIMMMAARAAQAARSAKK